MDFNFHAIWLTILFLSLLVVVHEFGHFIMARRFGVVVHEFSVGFGPLIGSIVRNGIRYSFRWFLLGGFVKIAGMDIALEGDPAAAKKDDSSEVAEKQEESEATTNQNGILFSELPLWKKIVIIAAGPIFNLILGVILVFTTALFIGMPDKLSSEPVIRMVYPHTPAFYAGLEPGDRILSINNEPIKQWLDIPQNVDKAKGKALRLEIKRKERLLVKEITPKYNSYFKNYKIGIEGPISFRKAAVGEALQIAFFYPFNFVMQTVNVFSKIGFKDNSMIGPIGMVTIVDQVTKLPPFYGMELLINISMFLFLFNILPIPLPLLDGGWIVILLLERLMGREFTANQKAVAQLIGLAAVLILGIFVAQSDIAGTIRRFQP